MERSGSLGVLLEYAQDTIVLIEDDGTVTYVNEAVERNLGHDPEDLVGENAFEFIHPSDVDRVREAFAETIGSEPFAETTVEYRFQANDGSWISVESRMSNLTDSELDGYVVSSRDISDRVAAERRQEETSRRLEELAGATGDVLWMFDADWSEVLFVNPAYEMVFGQPVAELEADPQSFLQAIHPDDRPTVMEAMARLSSGVPVDIEYRVDPSADYDTWVWVQGEPIVEDDEVVRVTGFVRDVTDRRRRERQLYVMDNLLRHNLRNDLNVILGNAELIGEEVPEVSDRTAVIRRTGEELLSSAEKERDIIEVLTGRNTREPVDISGVVERSVETVRERFPEATIAVDRSADVSVFALEEIGTVVIELLENAISHSDQAEPAVEVSVHREDEHVHLCVEDASGRIPEVEANVLEGVHDMDDVYHSSGLGLWLVYWIVDLSEGEITVTETDRGNRVTVQLPIVEE